MVNQKLVKYLREELNDGADLAYAYKNLVGEYSEREIHDAMDYILYSPYSHLKAMALLVFFSALAFSAAYGLIYYNEYVVDAYTFLFSSEQINATNATIDFCEFNDARYKPGDYICDSNVLKICNDEYWWQIMKVCQPPYVCNVKAQGCS